MLLSIFFIINQGKWGGKIVYTRKGSDNTLRPGFLLKTKKSDTKVEKKNEKLRNYVFQADEIMDTAPKNNFNNKKKQYKIYEKENFWCLTGSSYRCRCND